MGGLCSLHGSRKCHKRKALASVRQTLSGSGETFFNLRTKPGNLATVWKGGWVYKSLVSSRSPSSSRWDSSFCPSARTPCRLPSAWAQWAYPAWPCWHGPSVPHQIIPSWAFCLLFSCSVYHSDYSDFKKKSLQQSVRQKHKARHYQCHIIV